MSEQLEDEIITEIIQLVQEMHEKFPKGPGKIVGESMENISRSMEILSHGAVSYSKEHSKEHSKDKESTGYKEIKTTEPKVVKKSVNSQLVAPPEVRPRIKPIQDSKEKYNLPEGWEIMKFDDPIYQTWRTAMIKSLSEQPDMQTTVPKLYKELIAGEFL